MKFIKVLTIAGMAAFAISPVAAQTIGIGTTAKGATSSLVACKCVQHRWQEHKSIYPLLTMAP
jgi:hypothetical protein